MYLFFGFSYIVQLFMMAEHLSLLIPFSWLTKVLYLIQTQKNDMEGRTQVMIVYRIEMVWVFFHNEDHETWDCLPFNCLSPFGKTQPQLRSHDYNIAPSPVVTRRQYWDFLDWAFLALSRPHYLTKKGELWTKSAVLWKITSQGDLIINDQEITCLN